MKQKKKDRQKIRKTIELQPAVWEFCHMDFVQKTYSLVNYMTGYYHAFFMKGFVGHNKVIIVNMLCHCFLFYCTEY